MPFTHSEGNATDTDQVTLSITASDGDIGFLYVQCTIDGRETPVPYSVEVLSGAHAQNAFNKLNFNSQTGIGGPHILRASGNMSVRVVPIIPVSHVYTVIADGGS